MGKYELPYLFVNLLIGISALTIIVFFYHARGLRRLRSSLMMYGTFTILSLLNLATTYMRLMGETIDEPLYYLLLFLENPVALTLMIYYLPHFAHTLCAVKNGPQRDKRFAFVALVLFVFHTAMTFISLRFPETNYSGMVKNAVLGFVILYSWTILLRNTPTLLNIDAAAFRRTLWFFLLVIPFVLQDMFLLRWTGVKFFPMVYSAVGMVLARFAFLEHYLPMTSTDQRGTATEHDAFPSEWKLSSREEEVLVLLVAGRSYQEIAEALFISLNTVKSHIRNSYSKLNVSGKEEFIAKLRAHRESEARDAIGG